MKPFLDMKAIRETLRKWVGSPKEKTWTYLGKIDPFNYDDTPRPPGTRGRPREPTNRLSKKDLKLRKQWRQASNRYWIINRDEILLKSARRKVTHNLPLYKRIFGS